VEKISKHSNMPEEKVRKLIEEKEEELSGLVSKEGAAYIVARETGLSLIKETKRRLKIGSIVSGLRSVDVVARIMSMFPARDFEKNGKKGSVANIMLGDDTGMIRMSLWNDEIQKINGLKEGDVIKVTKGYTKVDYKNEPELRLGKGRIEKVDEEVGLPDKKEMRKDFSVAKRSNISDFKEGSNYETRACLVQMFRRNPFFEICPVCRSRLKEKEGKWVCDEHKEVSPNYNMVLSGIIDDGYSNIRAVFFGESAEKLFSKNMQELREIAHKNMDALSIYDYFLALGQDFLIKGRVRRNSFTENIEFIVNSIEDIDVKKEIDNLMVKLKA